jgi:hypothetical protein
VPPYFKPGSLLRVMVSIDGWHFGSLGKLSAMDFPRYFSVELSRAWWRNKRLQPSDFPEPTEDFTYTVRTLDLKDPKNAAFKSAFSHRFIGKNRQLKAVEAVKPPASVYELTIRIPRDVRHAIKNERIVIKSKRLWRTMGLRWTVSMSPVIPVRLADSTPLVL